MEAKTNADLAKVIRGYFEQHVTALNGMLDNPKMGIFWVRRDKIVQGMSSTGIHAVCEVFDVPMDTKVHWDCRSSALVQESASPDLFWRELLNGLASNAFGETPADRRKIFKAVEIEYAQSPVSERQIRHGAEHPYTAWKSYLIYFQAKRVIEILRIYKKKSGGNFPVQQRGLLHQMRMRRYWVASNSKFGHKQKFDGVNRGCWCIAVDRHEQGYIAVSDEEWEASFIKPDGSRYTSDKWIDPRRGALCVGGIFETATVQRLRFP